MAAESDNPEIVTSSGRLGLQDGYSIAFPSVVRLAFSHADKVVLGDTGHDHYQEIWGELAKPETQIAVAESGGAHVFLELPRYRQGLVNEFQREVARGRDPDAAEFADEFENRDDYDNNIDFWKFNPEEATQDLLQNVVAPILVQTGKVGVDVHMMDNGHGLHDKMRAEYVAEDLYQAMQEIARIKAEQDLEDPRVQRRLEHLERRVSEELEPDFQELRAKYLEERHDDASTARFVNRTSDGEKSLVLYGAGHGSRHDDFEDQLDGRAIKIDVAISRESYETEFAERMERLRTQSMNPDYGEDPADLVYFLDEGVLSTTTNTPADIVDALKAQAPLFVPQPIEDSAPSGDVTVKP